MLSIDEKTVTEYFRVRDNWAFQVLDNYKIIRITGNDAASYLQSQTSNDVTALKTGQGHFNSLLERKAHLLAFFSSFRLEDSFLLFTGKEQGDTLEKHLDEFHFSEDFYQKDISNDFSAVLIQGPLSAENLP